MSQSPAEIWAAVFADLKPPQLTIPHCEIRRRVPAAYVPINTTPIDDDIVEHIFGKQTMGSSNPEPVRVGVSVVIFRLRTHESEKRVVTEFLLGLRGGKHCPGTWGLPGGAMEFGEAPLTTARREVWEEVGFDPDENLLAMYPNHLVPYGNTVFENGKHFITLYFVAPWKDGEPRRMEPEKCLEWRWVTLDNLPQPLFPALVSNPNALDRLGWVNLATNYETSKTLP